MGYFQQFFGDLRTPLYKNAIYLMANTILASVLGFLFWIAVARNYAPHEVGLAAAIIPIMGFIAMLSSLGFGQALVRFLPSAKERSRVMINSCLTISGAATVLISLLFLLGLEIWSPALLFLRDNWIFFACLIVFSVVFTLFPTISSKYINSITNR